MRGLLLLLALVITAPALSQPTVDAVRFRNFGIATGLSQVTARALLQDERGFLWIGTQDGLNRFDGYDFRVYARDRADPAALSDSHITALARAEHGRIWVGTMAGGLNLLDPADDVVRRWRHQPGVEGALAGDSVLALLRDRRGALWVSTSVGRVQRLAYSSEKFETMEPADAGPLGAIRALTETADGAIWLGGTEGLWRYRLDAGQWTHFGVDTGVLTDIQALAPGPDGGVWIGSTREGLMRVDANGRRQAHYRADPDVEGSLPDDQVRCLLTTRAGQLWVGSMNGLAIFEPNARRFLTWRHDASDVGSPAGNRIAALYEDRDGLIWIGTWTGGFSIHNPATQVVRLIRAHGRDRSSLPGNAVRALWMESDGSLWMGVLDGGGLVHYDLRRGVIGRWTHDPNDPHSLASNVVQSIARTADGRLWVGTQGAGLSVMRADGSGFDQYRKNPEDPASLPDNVVQVLFVDRENRLWVGTENGGLARLRDGAAGFDVYRHDPADALSLPGNSVYAITETRDGEFWIGMFGAGMARMDRSSGRFVGYRQDPDRLDSLSHNSVGMIVEGSEGTLWVATQGGGLNRVRRNADGSLSFRAIGKREGLGAEAIGTIIEDSTGLIWIGTTVGVNAYNPRMEEVQSFSASDGMDRSGYFIGAVARAPTGEVYLGGLRGVLAFHPERLPKRGRAPSIVLTELRLNNRPTLLSRLDPASPLTRNLHVLETLELSHAYSSLAISFSALDFANPDGMRYSYRMDGFDADWIEGPNLPRTASYTNLPSGNYALRVRARGGEGGDFGPETQIALRLLPPQWRSPWALAAYALLALLLTLWTYGRAHRRWEREQAAALAIKRSEERLKLALWGSRDELWDVDLLSGVMERENMLPVLRGQASTHFKRREDFLAEIHPDDRAKVLQTLEAHLRGESEFYESTHRMRTTSGGWCWVLTRGFAVERDAQGRTLRMVGTSRDVSDSAQAAEALRKLNDELEHRVEERTRALRLSNRELQFTLEELKHMQKQLVESEKMAALGGLVAGIAHEINTPLGIGVTAASHLEDETRRFMQLCDGGKIGRSDLLAYQNDALDSARLILANLRRAGQLIRSFKQVAVDQSSEQLRTVNLKSYLEEVLLSLGPALKKTPHRLSIKCPDDLEVSTYPGAISQIVVNLVMNSLIHAFEGIDSGEIRIECESYDGEWLLLYRDNGIGMSEDIRQRVFHPFFTTKRGQGGSGLGLHVVYNLVTQLLGGSLDCISETGKGVEFQIQLPLHVGQR